MLDALLHRLRVFFRRDRTGDLDEEIRFHIEQATAAEVAAGHTSAEARRRALIAFGGVERTREQSYEQHPGWWMESVWQDVRYALRGFRRNKIFAIAVIATLALGIGATTAVFSVVDRILFRALPYAHDDRLVSVGLVQSLERQEFTAGGFFFDWRDHQQPFAAFASQSAMTHACDLVENNPAQLGCMGLQAEFLPMLGVSPALGRSFLPEEDRPNGPRVVLISYALWQSHFGGDKGILDRLVDVDGTPQRVVGVLPRDFELPTLQSADVFFPLALDEAKQRKLSPGQPMRTFARLKPGVTIAQAREQMQPLYAETEHVLIPPPIRKDFHLSIRSLRDRETQDVQRMSWILLGSVAAVLLIACANVTGLMVARSAAREREFAVRSALGAGRGRLMRQTMIESLLLSLAGWCAGLVLAEVLLRVFLSLAPTGIPFLKRAHLDLRIGLVMLALSLLCGVICGILPALERPRSLAARGGQTMRHTLLRRMLVVAQISVSIVLLSSAALLVRSFRNLADQRLGLSGNHVMLVRAALPESHYNSGQKKLQFFLQAEEALRRIPGVEAVGWSNSFPPGGWQDVRRYSELAAEGRASSTDSSSTVVFRRVTPDYFRALNIPLIRGSNFTEQQRTETEPRMILSRLLAERLFPGEDPIGRRVAMTRSDPKDYTVVGIADNVKNGGLTEQDNPEIYALLRNADGDWNGRIAVGEEMSGGAPMMAVASTLPDSVAEQAIRTQIAQLDHRIPVEVEPFTAHVSKLADRPRFATALLGYFAANGLLMAIIGLYGIVAFMVANRTQEIGVRMALGADRADILRLMTWEGMRLIVTGCVVGLAVTLGVTRILSGLLFQVDPHDPGSLAVSLAMLGTVAIAATLIPARRAMKTDPMVALRCE